MQHRLLLVCTMLVILTSLASAQQYQPAGEEWITKWWGLDLVTNTGGFNASAAHDWLSEGTDGEITQESVSTTQGIRRLQQIDTVELDDANGGELTWSVVTIDPNDGNNMSTSHDLPPQDNIEWYGIIVVKSPNARTTTIHPAHDDYAHIWLNGDKVYDNPEWTGGATIVTTPTEVDLARGENVLLFRCGESGGSDYVNLHFEPTDEDLKIVPTMDDKFWPHVSGAFAVEPVAKAALLWADLKRYQGR